MGDYFSWPRREYEPEWLKGRYILVNPETEKVMAAHIKGVGWLGDLNTMAPLERYLIAKSAHERTPISLRDLARWRILFGIKVRAGTKEIASELAIEEMAMRRKDSKAADALRALKTLRKKKEAKGDDMAESRDSKILEMSWSEIEQVLAAPSARRVLLMGPPGTGKTFLGAHPSSKKQRVFQTTLTEETPAAELRGHFVPAGTEFRWHDGPAVAAWRYGGRLVLNEIDRCSPDAMIFLHAILDDPEFAMLTLPTLEEVRPADGFSVVATMNAEDVSVLSDALADRFAVKIMVRDTHPKALSALPGDLQETARVMANVKDNNRRMSIRAWYAFAALREETNVDLAGKAVFGARWQDVKTALALKSAADSK